MKLDIETGLLEQARQVSSPNQDARPAGCEPELLVIHSISLPPGEFGGPWIERLFCNTLDSSAHPYFAEIAELKVSAHLLIRRDGELIQFVPFNRRAWHAGVSCYEDRERCNDFSIGIEMEGTDEGDFTNTQYAVLVEVVAALDEAYPGLSPERIAGHSDIAPGRKRDPGPGFNWLGLRRQINARRGV
jgi:AmpD protein